MTAATFVILAIAAALFGSRLLIGPRLADRVVAANGLVLVGMGAIATQAAHSGIGSFIPTLVAVSLAGPISTGMIARFMEARNDDR